MRIGFSKNNNKDLIKMFEKEIKGIKIKNQENNKMNQSNKFKLIIKRIEIEN